LAEPITGEEKVFLGAFGKLQKATINFVVSACLSGRLSVRMEQLGSQWTGFQEF
jgi:hypothetical protein